MITQDVAPVSTDLETLRREHDDRLTVLAMTDEADDRREQEIIAELERIRAGTSLADAAALLAERRDLQQRRQDRRVSRELTEAARREVDVGILRAKLESEIPSVEAELRQRAEEVRGALLRLSGPAQALFAATDAHKALQHRLRRFRGEHGGGPSPTPLDRLTGLPTSVPAALRIIVTDAARQRKPDRPEPGVD